MTSQAEQFNQRNIDEFRASHGRVGGTFAVAPLLLLHTVGARSGQQRINPVMYLADGDRYLVFASKAGSDSNPDWYWNLRATPDTAIEVGDETIAVRATELTGAERDEKYRTQSERFPGFAGYQQKTSSSGLRHELVALGVVEDRGVAGPERHLSLRFAGDDRKPSQASSSLP